MTIQSVHVQTAPCEKDLLHAPYFLNTTNLMFHFNLYCSLFTAPVRMALHTLESRTAGKGLTYLLIIGLVVFPAVVPRSLVEIE